MLTFERATIIFVYLGFCVVSNFCENIIKPIHYDLTITTNIHNGGDTRYTGRVRIDFIPTRLTNHLAIKSQNLTILDVFQTFTINRIAAFKIDSLTYVVDQANDFVNVTLKSGNFRCWVPTSVYITFEGYLRNDTLGFYRTSFKDKDNEIKWMAATHFETMFAHSAFPCFDDISLKATFTLRITHHPTFMVLSNMPKLLPACNL